MENSNLPSTIDTNTSQNITTPITTTTTTTLQNQEQTLFFEYPQIPYHMNQAYAYPGLIMPYPYFINTPFYPNPYHNMQFPYGYAVPVTFPPYPYHVGESGMENPMPNISQPVFLQNQYYGQMVQWPQSLLWGDQTNASRVTGSPSSATTSRRRSTRGSSNTSINNQDSDTFYTSNNKKLKILVRKELSSSDVGPGGRIVLPKREAEKNLPNLSSNEGIRLVFKDVYSAKQWQMRYTFWSNYKGKMFVLDQIGDFVSQNRLEMGDLLTLYEDEHKDLYFSINKTKRSVQQTSSTTPVGPT